MKQFSAKQDSIKQDSTKQESVKHHFIRHFQDAENRFPGLSCLALTVFLVFSGIISGFGAFAADAYAAGSLSGTEAPGEAVCSHVWSDWDVYEEPTCVDTGEKWRECTLCGEEELQEIPATGVHEWADWETVRAATALKAGKKVKECFFCDAKKTKTIPKLKAYVKFTKKSYTVTAGKTIQLKIKYAKGDKAKKWTSSNTKTASVTKKGVVKGKKAGTVKITVVMKSGKKASCTVKVKAAKTKASSSASESSKDSSSRSRSGSGSGTDSPSGGSSSGGGTVYWTPGGSVYHSTRSCPTLSRSRTVYSGSISDSGKPRGCKVCY